MSLLVRQVGKVVIEVAISLIAAAATAYITKRIR